jgi:hypothetical protein
MSTQSEAKTTEEIESFMENIPKAVAAITASHSALE